MPDDTEVETAHGRNTPPLTLEAAAIDRLQALNAKLFRAPDAAAVLAETMDAASTLLHADMGSAEIFDAESGYLELVASQGFAFELPPDKRRVKVGNGSICALALAAGRQVVLDDILAEPRCAEVHTAARVVNIRGALATPLFNRNGTVLAVISTYFHRPHRPAEAELRILDLIVNQATHLIERFHAEEALREADRRKDEFLATLAHELRNPLSPIVNGLELLTGEGRDPLFFDDIHATLTRQAQHMVRLVDDLLDVSRITRGKIELRRDRVDVATIVASAVETARPVIDAGGHALTVRLPEGTLLVDADASRLSQVLSNLLNNAAKYMEPGGEITIAALREDDQAVVRVVDRGIGIPPELLERVFDLFTQADQSMERSHSGLGVGLTIAKRLVEMHGGTVVAHSAGSDRGSELVVRLPICADQELAPAPAADAEPEAVPRRVLVIDDNESVLKSLCLLLKALGHEVRGANNGHAGVALGAEFRPEVVLLDLAMPQCSGFETARLLREEPWGRDVVLVALTGWGQEEHRQRTKQAGFDHHFVKPIDGRHLQALLADLTRARV